MCNCSLDDVHGAVGGWVGLLVQDVGVAGSPLGALLQLTYLVEIAG